MTVAEMLILVGDNPERIKSEAALAKLCGVCPIPASSDKTNRMRLNRGVNRQANAALYGAAVVRMRDDDRTKCYAARRTSEGKTRREIVRCIKRYIVRKIYHALCEPALDRHGSFNAAVETFFKTIKAELLWQRSCQTRRDAEMAIFEYINCFYNPLPRHSALGWKSPLAF